MQKKLIGILSLLLVTTLLFPLFSAAAWTIEDKMDDPEEKIKDSAFHKLAFKTDKDGKPLEVPDEGWQWGNTVKPKDIYGYLLALDELSRTTREYGSVTYNLPGDSTGVNFEATFSMIFSSYSRIGGWMDGWELNTPIDVSKITPKYISKDGQAWIVRDTDDKGNKLSSPVWARFAKDAYSYIYENPMQFPEDPKRQICVEYSTDGNTFKELDWKYKSVIDLNDRSIETITCKIPNKAVKVRVGLTMPFKAVRTTTLDELSGDERRIWGSQCAILNVKMTSTNENVKYSDTVIPKITKPTVSDKTTKTNTTVTSEQTTASESTTVPSETSAASETAATTGTASQEPTTASISPGETDDSNILVPVIIGAVIVVAAGGAAAYFLYKNKKKA